MTSTDYILGLGLLAMCWAIGPLYDYYMSRKYRVLVTPDPVSASDHHAPPCTDAGPPDR